MQVTVAYLVAATNCWVTLSTLLDSRTAEFSWLATIGPCSVGAAGIGLSD
jgi:hypothetical protein